MTVRQVYESVLIELRKLHAPSLKLFEFNYYLLKAINQYVNKVYNVYDINQQTSDDLRVLTVPAELIPLNNVVIFPKDYLHLLSCICVFENPSPCVNKKDLKVKATRLTADSMGMVMENYYNRPSIKKPYYYIRNESQEFKEYAQTDIQQSEDSLSLINLSAINKTSGERYGNASVVRCEIIFGDKEETLKSVKIEYVRSPKHVELTQDQLNKTEDYSQTMEFPDYVNQEIINELVNLVLEQQSNPRLTTNIQMTNTIARPTGQQQAATPA